MLTPILRSHWRPGEPARTFPSSGGLRRLPFAPLDVAALFPVLVGFCVVVQVARAGRVVRAAHGNHGRRRPANLPYYAASVDGFSGLLEILRDAGYAAGELRLTPAGRTFADADIQSSKRLFARVATERVPLVRTIENALARGDDGALKWQQEVAAGSALRIAFCRPDRFAPPRGLPASRPRLRGRPDRHGGASAQGGARRRDYRRSASRSRRTRCAARASRRCLRPAPTRTISPHRSVTRTSRRPIASIDMCCNDGGAVRSGVVGSSRCASQPPRSGPRRRCSTMRSCAEQERRECGSSAPQARSVCDLRHETGRCCGAGARAARPLTRAPHGTSRSPDRTLFDRRRSVEKAGKGRRRRVGLSNAITTPDLNLALCRAFPDGETRTRTGDTTIFSRVLYQLSYLANGLRLACPGLGQVARRRWNVAPVTSVSARPEARNVARTPASAISAPAHAMETAKASETQVR